MRKEAVVTDANVLEDSKERTVVVLLMLARQPSMELQERHRLVRTTEPASTLSPDMSASVCIHGAERLATIRDPLVCQTHARTTDNAKMRTVLDTNALALMDFLEFSVRLQCPLDALRNLVQTTVFAFHLVERTSPAAACKDTLEADAMSRSIIVSQILACMEEFVEATSLDTNAIVHKGTLECNAGKQWMFVLEHRILV